MKLFIFGGGGGTSDPFDENDNRLAEGVVIANDRDSAEELLIKAAMKVKADVAVRNGYVSSTAPIIPTAAPCIVELPLVEGTAVVQESYYDIDSMVSEPEAGD